MHPTQGDDLPARPTTTPAELIPPPVPDYLYPVWGTDRVGYDGWRSLDGGILQHLTVRDGLLIDLVRSIEKRYLEKIGQDHSHVEGDRLGGPAIDEVVDLLVTERPANAELRALVGDDQLDLPLPQAAAVTRFLRAYPEFWQRLRPRIKKIMFDSRKANGRGGGEFVDGVIHISKLPTTPPAAFVRLLVHEAGHAMFEPVLLSGKLPSSLVAPPSPETFDLLPTGLAQPSTQADPTLRAHWAHLPDPAKQFYSAWLTLREDSGKHFLGFDMWIDPNGNRLNADQRRRYQAGGFDEFCAESFMQYTMGDLHAHYQAIQTGRSVPDTVKTAWKLAWSVLDTMIPPTIGPRAS
ncbi:MAG: hypothetical protein HOY78_01080 [Saccharothrix sp.]|nr:hypothetical protein [Saccharothrix sp.]